jgi:hypothetical protein
VAWTTPRTWVASELVTASLMNQHVRDNLAAIGDPWAAYTGTNTNLTLGNGTLDTRAMRAGKTVHYSIDLTFGSTTAFSAAPRFGLPVLPSVAVNGRPIGHAMLFDTSAAARRLWHAAWITGDNGVTPLDDSFAGINATTPWTWATGDRLIMTGTYESA